jgi:hypothetical protein|tara:strand:+ start:2196 stop:2876 length:681 start_codon:yes stop_codon:yes gene_type:complete
MKTIPINKAGGFALCLGSLLLTIPFILQITFGGTPEEGTLIWRYFSNEIISGGALSLLYPLLSVTGIAFLIFGLYTLNDLLQKEKGDGLLSLGTVFAILGSIGFMFAWSLDYHILWGQDVVGVGEWKDASLGMTMEIGIVLLFGAINWSGIQCIASALAMRKYGNTAILKITSIFAGLHVVNHFYTIFNLDPMSSNSIMPFFIGMTVGQLVLLAFNVSLGLRMIKQ